MRRQDAMKLLGVSEQVFLKLVKEKSIRRTTLRNGFYSYNEQDINRLLTIFSKDKKTQ